MQSWAKHARMLRPCPIAGQQLRRTRREIQCSCDYQILDRCRARCWKTKSAPILLHVAKDESHVAAGESGIWTCLVSTLQAIEALCRSDMESAQTMIKVLKTNYAPRLCKLAHEVDPDRVVQGTAKWIDHADEVPIEAQAEDRISPRRRRTHATESHSQWLETVVEKSKHRSQMDDPN